MSGAGKLVEHMGHAAHAPHHEASTPSPLGMRIGATMASLGAVLALFTVTATAARTELLGLYTQQTIASLRLETSATNYRILETQLRQLHALSPERADVKQADAELASIAQTGPDAARATRIARLAVAPVIGGLTPTATDLARFVRLIRGYRAEREAAAAWLATFEGPEAWLTTAIEHYEWAELCAELGIVASSLALLLSSRKIWLATLALGATGLVIFGATAVPTVHRMHDAERAIHEAKAKTEASLETTQSEEAEDESLLRAVERAP